MTVDGGPGIKRAVINAHEGTLVETRIDDGHDVDFDCPSSADSAGVDLIADLVTDEVVHWKDIGVGPRGAVRRSEQQQGVPDDLSAEELKQLQSWDLSARNLLPTDGAAPTTLVVFMPNELPWAQLRIQGPGDARLRLTLDGTKKKRELPVGRYKIQVRDRPSGSWQRVGSLQLEAKRAQYVVKLVRKPDGVGVETSSR